MSPKICTGIVTFNRLELLKDALNSIKAQTQPTDIIVVNNGSTDGTKEFLETQEDITVINQENVGGAGGFFAATKAIAEKGYEFAWMMDDDIIAAPDTLKNLYNAYLDLATKEDIGFLCSTVISAEGDIVNVPEIDTAPNNTGYASWNIHLDKCYVKVKTATFVSVFLPVRVIRKVGLPIKEFFIWGDDTEYTRRISANHPCYLVGTSIIRHLRNGGNLNLKNITDIRRIKMFKYYIRNNYYNTRIKGKTIAIVLYWLVYLKHFFYYLLTGKWLKSKIVITGLFKGITFNPTIKYPN